MTYPAISFRTSTTRKIAATIKLTTINKITALAAAGGYCTMAIWFDMAMAMEADWLPLMTLTTKKSPITRVITKIDPKAIPVRESGITMSQMMLQALAPPSWAASISDLSILAMELKMGTIMNSVNKCT